MSGLPEALETAREAGEVLTIFRKPLKESLTSVLPITAIVLVLCFTITLSPTTP